LPEPKALILIKSVILSEASRSLIARGAVEGPAVAFAVACTSAIPIQTHVISTEGGALCRRSGETPVFRLCRCLCLSFCLSSRTDLRLPLLLPLPVLIAGIPEIKTKL
jgi:hypothetical protein